MTAPVWDQKGLERWAAAALEAAGAGGSQAGTTAACLLDADRRGIDTHGIAMLRMYLPRLASGAIDGHSEPLVERELPGSAHVDGRNGLGPFVARCAVDLACRKAGESGAAAVAVHGSNHFGAASVHSEHAARSGFVAVVVSNSDPSLAPPGGLAPVLGTNPIGIAGPPGEHAAGPSLDMATSLVALGRVRAAARAGDPIDPSWALGPDGHPTTDPGEALRGSLLPAAGYKGFALAAAIDVLAGCLTGARISPEIPGGPEDPERQDLGHLVIALDVEAFAGEAAYRDALDRLSRRVHGAARTNGTSEFQLPGEPEARRADERAGGIPLAQGTATMLAELGSRFGTPFPESRAG